MGPRAACALVAARLAMLRLLSGPLASLSQALQMCGVEMGDALALLRTRGLPADASSGVRRLVQTVCAARQQAPDPAVLGALIAQLQGPEDVLAAWQADRQQAAEAQPRSPECRRRTPSPSKLPAKRARHAEGQAKHDAGGRADEASAPPRLAAASVLCWVGPSSKQPERTPASDAGIERGFPPALTDAGDRFELLEALLAHGVIYTASDEGWPGNAAAHHRPAHRLWGWKGDGVAVGLERLWAQLPRAMREWLKEQGSGSGGGAGSRRSGEVVLGEFIAGRCHAVRLVEEAQGRAPSAALGHSWLGALVRHRLFARLVGELQAATCHMIGNDGGVRSCDLPNDLTPGITLYMQVSAACTFSRSKRLATPAPLPSQHPFALPPRASPPFPAVLAAWALCRCKL
jgi:hypothetical protein